MKQKETLAAGDLSLFCSQAALLVKSGIPLDDGLSAIGETMPEEGKKLLAQVESDYHEQYSLELALDNAGVFPDYLVKMVGIGERSGKLEEVLEALSVYYDRDSRMKTQIRQAVFYPMVSVCAMAIVVAVLVWKVLPIFEEVLESLGGSVGVLSGLGPGLGIGVLIFLGLLILCAAVSVILIKTGHGGWLWKIFARIRPVQHVMKKISASRFASVLSMLLSSGYQIEEALEFLPAILPDKESAEKVSRISKRMAEGESLPDAIQAEQIFPGLYSRMVAIGFRTGAMDTVMAKLAEIYEDDADHAVQSLIGVLEPLLVGILSAAVGVILFSVMLPLLGIMSSIG